MWLWNLFSKGIDHVGHSARKAHPDRMEFWLLFDGDSHVQYSHSLYDQLCLT